MEINAVGPFCALGSSLTWAIGTSGYSKLTEKYSPYSVNFLRACVALPFFFLVSWVNSGGLLPLWCEFKNIQASHIGWFAVSLIASHGVGDVLFLLSTRHLGISAALAISSCCPIWTTLAGHFVAHQPVVFHHVVGLVVTLIGLVTVILRSQASNERPPKGNPTQGILLASGTSILWALNAFSSIQGASHLPVGFGNFLQMGMSLVSTWIFCRIFTSKLNLILPSYVVKKFFPFFIVEAFLGNLLYMYGISHSSYAQGLTLASLAPVMSIPIGIIFGVECFSWIKTVGIITVVTGSTLLLLPLQ